MENSTTGNQTEQYQTNELSFEVKYTNKDEFGRELSIPKLVVRIGHSQWVSYDSLHRAAENNRKIGKRMNTNAFNSLNRNQEEAKKAQEVVQNTELENLFSYHSPTGNQTERYESLRSFAKALAYQIYAFVPGCADRNAAIRKLRECVMTANAAIACNEVSEV